MVNRVANAKMVVDINEMRFEKYPSSATVNIYVDGTEVDCFTNYSIGSDFEKFEESCQSHYDYLTNEGEE